MKVPATHTWPMDEGFANLVRVRRRQNRGVDEIAREHPALLATHETPPVGAGDVLRRMIGDPVGFAVYGAVSLAVKLPVLGGGGR